jgi:putative ABC transport system permease protein
MAVLALALGIGANSNIFSFVNAYLLKPLPSVKDTGRLMLFQTRIRQNTTGSSYLDFSDFARQSRAFESISAAAWMGPILSGRGEPERLRGKQISSGYFDVFTVQPVLGRRFAPSETERVVLLSDGFWQRRFGGDPGIVGQSITLDDASYQVVGVMPPRFRTEWQDLDVWTPLPPEVERTPRGRRNLDVIARLRAGATRASAQSEISTIATRLAASYPDTNKDVNIALVDYVEALGNGPRESIQIMVGVAIFVLLIACSNVANLQVARATGRVNEIAIRVAMGANRWRIVRQVMIESTVVALAGGVAGFGLSQVGVKLLLAYLPAEFQPINKDFLDARVVLFTAAVSLVTGIVSGIAPAFQVSRISVNDILKEGGRGMGAGSRSRLRNALVVVEMSLALVLLLASGLLMQSFVRMQTIDPGFRTGNLLAAYVALPEARYPKPEQRLAFFRDLVEKAGAIGGVRAAAASTGIPLMGGGQAPYLVYEGQSVPAGGSEFYARSRSVSPNYLQAMGIVLRRGRYLTEQDAEGAPRVAIVNERFASRFFPGADPVGRRFQWGRVISPSAPWITVVGVIGDVKSWNLTAAPPPEVFVPMRQSPSPGNWIVMRTASSDPTSVAPAFREAVRALDRNQPIGDLEPMDKVLHETMTIPRMMTTLMTLFAAIALAMAALGIYGVVAYSAAQRTREIGIRMALGAGAPNVIRLVLRQALWMVGAGVVVGIPAAAATTKVLGSYLYGVTARDPLTFIAVPVGLSLIALGASYLPARRATQIDPVVALRFE